MVEANGVRNRNGTRRGSCWLLPDVPSALESTLRHRRTPFGRFWKPKSGDARQMDLTDRLRGASKSQSKRQVGVLRSRFSEVPRWRSTDFRASFAAAIQADRPAGSWQAPHLPPQLNFQSTRDRNSERNRASLGRARLQSRPSSLHPCTGWRVAVGDPAIIGRNAVSRIYHKRRKAQNHDATNENRTMRHNNALP